MHQIDDSYEPLLDGCHAAWLACLIAAKAHGAILRQKLAHRFLFFDGPWYTLSYYCCFASYRGTVGTASLFAVPVDNGILSWCFRSIVSQLKIAAGAQCFDKAMRSAGSRRCAADAAAAAAACPGTGTMRSCYMGRIHAPSCHARFAVAGWLHRKSATGGQHGLPRQVPHSCAMLHSDENAPLETPRNMERVASPHQPPSNGLMQQIQCEDRAPNLVNLLTNGANQVMVVA